SATRTYVEAASHDEGVLDAEQAARDVIDAYGRDGDGLTIDAPADSSSFQPCTRVSFTTRYRVPAVVLPFLGGFGDGFTVSSTDSELIDPGPATCAGTRERTPPGTRGLRRPVRGCNPRRRPQCNRDGASRRDGG